MQEPSSARLLFLGEKALAQGFSLIGFETWPDASVAELDDVLAEIRNDAQGALVIIDQRLAAAGSKRLPIINSEGRHVVVIEVPSLSDAKGFRLDIDAQVEALLGGQQPEN
jgi:vacuolar-type H+-ATPase subunit F/Vma7